MAIALPLAGWMAPAVAQPAPPDQTTTPTTVNPLQDLVDNLLGGGPSTTAPPADPGSSSGGGTTGQAPADGDTPPAPGAQVVPPEAQAAIDSVNRTPGRNTGELLTALRQLINLGMSPEEAAVVGMGHFPVGGQADYTDDFLFPRFNPEFHPHQGNDIFAAEGTPVRAPEDGSVRYTEGGISGKAVYVTTGNGTYYFGCHLVAFADLPSGSSVTQGQIIGFVGSTGDAAGGSPHLHFEIHPGGGAAVDPKSTLDRWIDEALANISQLVASYRQVGLPKAISYAGTLRRFDEPLASGSSVATLLNASSKPGIKRLTELRASRDLVSDSSKADAAVIDAWKAADRTSRSLLDLVTPVALQTVLAGKTN